MYEIPKSIKESRTILSKEHIILEKCGQILEKTIYLGVACKFTNCTRVSQQETCLRNLDDAKRGSPFNDSLLI